MSVKNILISQQQPQTASPYTVITEKFGVNFDFKPFFKNEPLSSREFRTQRINILDYTAIVFSARTTIDAFFHICEELRIKVPETMKYFCTSEAVANYLQKHIVYRKRKIFFGDDHRTHRNQAQGREIPYCNHRVLDQGCRDQDLRNTPVRI